MLLVVDNASIYTKNLINFLLEKKIKFKNIFHSELDFSKIREFNSIILSGRRENSKVMNALNSKIIQHAISEQKKLLGICYGAEILALTLGGTIRKKKTLTKGNQSITISKKNPLCSGTINVFESHNYEISKLGNSLIGIANSQNCLYEIIQYKSQNIFGTQFHPEMSSDGQKIIEAFISL